MAQLIEVKVPDIGDFKNVEIIEVLVKPGDAIKKEDSLISLKWLEAARSPKVLPDDEAELTLASTWPKPAATRPCA